MARDLTLDEKISIKGELATKGVSRHILVTLTMRDAEHLYYRCFGKPASMFNNPKLWRLGSRSAATRTGETHEPE